MTYVSQAIDISPDADRYQMALLRQKTSAQRYLIAAGMIRAGKRLSLLHHRRRRGAAAAAYFAKSILRGFAVSSLSGNPENWIQDPSEIAKILHEAMESLGIRYFISGGVAAIIHGDPRYTRDLDIVAQISQESIGRVVALLEQQRFYCPPGAVEEIQQGVGTILNVTHMDTALSADITIASETGFDQSEMSRRQLMDMGGGIEAWFISPEDLILSKLKWRAESEKQRRDVLAVMKVQEGLLDLDYLRLWAEQLGLSELVEQLLEQASTAELDGLE
jgi:hypothetical protein